VSLVSEPTSADELHGNGGRVFALGGHGDADGVVLAEVGVHDHLSLDRLLDGLQPVSEFRRLLVLHLLRSCLHAVSQFAHDVIRLAAQEAGGLAEVRSVLLL